MYLLQFIQVQLNEKKIQAQYDANANYFITNDEIMSHINNRR